MEKFFRGVQCLILPEFSGFNKRIKDREQEIRGILFRADVRVVLVAAYTSIDRLGEPVSAIVSKFLQAQNNAGDTEVFTYEVFDLKRIYGHLSGSADAKANFQIGLWDWGRREDPYKAYYGQVLVSEIATWAKYGRPLFAKNLRYYRGDTDVNEAIERTLVDRPTHFWYFNNGITILCKNVDKALVGGTEREHGIFDCTGVNIVNGAQTVGTIWEAAKRDPSCISQSKATAYVRLISLQNSPEAFGGEVTIAANTQNKIQHRDFAALDPEQERLAREMALDGKRYAFKSGDPDPEGENGCNIEEATVALACSALDVTMTVQAKREVGQLWQDITKPPYTNLFRPDLTSRAMWRAVLVLREVEKELRATDKSGLPRGELVAVHENRLILHRVFLDSGIAAEYRNPAVNEDDLVLNVRRVTKSVLIKLAELIERNYPGAYLATLAKNLQKNKNLEVALSGTAVRNENLTLFDDAQ
jgi:hypothetical protein